MDRKFFQEIHNNNVLTREIKKKTVKLSINNSPTTTAVANQVNSIAAQTSSARHKDVYYPRVEYKCATMKRKTIYIKILHPTYKIVAR